MSQDIVVTSEMNYTELFADKPLTGTITITHDRNIKVDINSFKLGDKPLKVNFLNDTAMSAQSPLVVSIYNFEIPPLPKGLHVLPQVSVKVGHKIYKSFSRSFEVFGADKAAVQTTPLQAPVQAPPSSIPVSQSNNKSQNIEGSPVLLLETKVDGSTKLYPGEQTKFIYKFLYRGHIDLRKEELPLLDAVGLKKVGDKQIRDYEENNLNVSEFSQSYEADKPGTFQYGPSIIEGVALDSGNKPLHSETAPIAIEVMPFPIARKPASFNGSIGTYTFKATLNGQPNVNSGEKLTLLLEMTGDPKFLSTVQAPDLCCQPGFTGNFKPSDLPAISNITGNTKRFLVDLKPLSPVIKEIPPIEFSSFDINQNKYITVKTAPIAVSVSLRQGEIPKPQVTAEIQSDNKVADVQPIEIAGIYDLTKSDLQNQFAGNWWSILWFPAFAVLWFTEKNFKMEFDAKKLEAKEISSEELLKEALAQVPGSSEFYRLIQNALMMALKEQGQITNVEIEPESLEPTGLSGDVRIFLTKLNEFRFTGKSQFNQAILSSAQDLYTKIKGKNV